MAVLGAFFREKHGPDIGGSRTWARESRFEFGAGVPLSDKIWSGYLLPLI